MKSMREDLAQEQPGALALRVGEEFLWRGALDNLAAVHKHHQVYATISKWVLLRTRPLDSAANCVAAAAPFPSGS
jgi:hypothetical protein